MFPAASMWSCLLSKSCGGWNSWVSCCWFNALLCSTNVKRFKHSFYFVHVLILWLLWGCCDVMVIDQAKVNRLYRLMLHRLHASKAHKDCFQFCPLYSLSKTFPPAGSFFNLHVYFKRGWRMEGRKHLSISYKCISLH